MTAASLVRRCRCTSVVVIVPRLGATTACKPGKDLARRPSLARPRQIGGGRRRQLERAVGEGEHELDAPVDAVLVGYPGLDGLGQRHLDRSRSGAQRRAPPFRSALRPASRRMSGRWPGHAGPRRPAPPDPARFPSPLHHPQADCQSCAGRRYEVVRRGLQHEVGAVRERRHRAGQRPLGVDRADDASHIDPFGVSFQEVRGREAGPICSILSRTMMPFGRITRAEHSRSKAANSSSWLPSISTKS